MKKKKLLFTAIIITVALILTLAACNGGVLGNRSNANAGFYLIPEGSAVLCSMLRLDYNYGSFSEGTMYFTVSPFLTMCMGFGTDDMDVTGEVEESVMEDLAKIIHSNGIFLWDGFKAESDEAGIGYGFSLMAEFEHGTITAEGFEKVPENYRQGHSALSKYLESLSKMMIERNKTDEKAECEKEDSKDVIDFIEIKEMSAENIKNQFVFEDFQRRAKPDENGNDNVLILDGPGISFLFFDPWDEFFGVILNDETAQVCIFGVLVGMRQYDATRILKNYGFEQNPKVAEQDSLFFELALVPSYYDPNVDYYVDPMEYYFVEINTENGFVTKATVFYGNAALEWQEMRERVSG